MKNISEPLVSIIMNCYNGEKFLREAIDSVLAQTYKNWELIFWDNQSNDSSADIFRSYKDERLKYFFAPKHTLLYEARNNAIKFALGEFYAFLDVDDWWNSDKLERQIPLFDKPNVGLVYSNYWFENQSKGTSFIKFSKPLPSGRILNQLLGYCVVGLLTIIIRRHTFETLYPPGFNNKYHIIGDFDLVIKTSVSWDIECIDKPIAHYRWHGNNESILNRELQIDELSLWSSDTKDFLPESAKDGLTKFHNSLIYQKAQLHLQRQEYKDVWTCFKQLKVSIELIKLIALVVVPAFILNRIRST